MLPVHLWNLTVESSEFAPCCLQWKYPRIINSDLKSGVTTVWSELTGPQRPQHFIPSERTVGEETVMAAVGHSRCAVIADQSVTDATWYCIYRRNVKRQKVNERLRILDSTDPPLSILWTSHNLCFCTSGRASSETVHIKAAAAVDQVCGVLNTLLSSHLLVLAGFKTGTKLSHSTPGRAYQSIIQSNDGCHLVPSTTWDCRCLFHFRLPVEWLSDAFMGRSWPTVVETLEL